MFQKILIANRGEIALRIARTCREMKIPTVALYQAADQGSLHVRLADECVRLDAPGGFMNGDAILEIARAKGADAIHPGYGFLAEQAEFIRACEQAGIAFIGPPAGVVSLTANKIDALQRARAAGILTPEYVPICFEDAEEAASQIEAERLGYPLVVKSCRGGRGRGEHIISGPKQLHAAIRRARQEAQAVYGDPRIYFERAILPAKNVSVQILADVHGNFIQLGEREGSLVLGNQKVIEESPAPSLNDQQRHHVWALALDIARLFEYRNVGTVEFLLDADGNFYFTEIKARIQIVHPVTEMLTRLDLVREQIQLAAGARLDRAQAQVVFDGWTMQARISAQDPRNRLMPSPGILRHVRLPGGADVRTDTFVDSGCAIPPQYDPLIAKLVVWGKDRETCRLRLERALDEFQLIGTATTLPLLQQLVRGLEFAHGTYHMESLPQETEARPVTACTLRELAAAVAVYKYRVNKTFQPTTPDRLNGGWHRSGRRLPD